MRDQIRDLIERAPMLPQAMLAQHQWLVWRFVTKPGQDKPSKMPYYVNGNLRGWPRGKPRDGKATDEQPQVDQGHALDREHLVSLPRALDALKAGRWDGLGFAFLPGDGLIGIDVDHAIDADGVVADHCAEIIKRCDSYTELSPSGTGVHVIVSGDAIKTFKSNDVGVEVFCGRQFFTVTARPFGGQAQVKRISAETLDWLHVMVKGVPMANAAAPVAASRPAPPAIGAGGDAANSARRYCMHALNSGIDRMRAAGSGKRNDTLNAEAYGLAQLVHTGGISEIMIRSSLMDAALSAGLAQAEIEATMGSAIRAGLMEPRQLPERKHPERGQRGVRALPPAPPITDEGPDGLPSGELQEPPWLEASSPPPSPEGDGTEAPAKAKRGKGQRKPRELTPEQLDALERFYGRVDAMCERFTLIEPSETAWDHHERQIWQIKHMRISFTNDVVKAWLSRVALGQTRKVKAVDLVFEPGLEVAEHQINMFQGLPVEPVPCKPEEVAPMLNLLRHLCSASSEDSDEVDNVVEWVLRWQAYPLQHLGAKMQSACLFHGAQGTGKNLYWDAWRDLFGDMGVTVGQTELEDKSNAWISRKLAIIGDEVLTRQEMEHKKNALKMVVTQKDRFPIRAMYMDTRWESNHANVVFLSNELRPMALEDRDRRHMVVYTPLEAAQSLYDSVRDFLNQPDALGKWLHYLQTYPLDKFTEHTKPPLTGAKTNLIQLNWKPADRFAHEWMDGFMDLPFHPCSAEQLYRAFRRWCDRQGERFPPPQAQFTSQVERFGRESVQRDANGKLPPPRLIYKQIQLVRRSPDGHEQTATVRKTTRCWLPVGTGPRDGQPLGEWMAGVIDDFETPLSAFSRTPGRPEDAAAAA